MTNFSFKAYDYQGDLIFIGSDGLCAIKFELCGFIVKRFLNGEEL
jgi:hypothetical protein